MDFFNWIGNLFQDDDQPQGGMGRGRGRGTPMMGGRGGLMMSEPPGASGAMMGGPMTVQPGQYRFAIAATKGRSCSARYKCIWDWLDEQGIVSGGTYVLACVCAETSSLCTKRVGTQEIDKVGLSYVQHQLYKSPTVNMHVIFLFSSCTLSSACVSLIPCG
jgi:hypothetical protein